MTDEAQVETSEAPASLDSIIKGEDTPTEPVGQETVTKEPEPKSPEVVKPEPTTDDDAAWTKAMALDERRKRQELEAKLAEYQSRETAEAPQRPDVLEDPEGAFRFTENSFEEKLFQERIAITKDLMMESKPDYLEKAAHFLEMVKENPSLEIEIRKSANPAKFAYNKAQEHLDYIEFQKTKETNEYKEFLEAKKFGKFEKPVEETPEQKRNKSALAVPNLNNATSAKSGSVEGEKSLKQILGR